jgi:DMSO/TMAO reductase YedYZ molybdopterin-dependent catalytic subunit
MSNPKIDRREFLGSVAATLAVSACATGESGLDLDQNAEPVLEQEPLAPVTSNEEFYDVSYNGRRIPQESWADDWALTLVDLDGNEAVFTLAQLQALGGQEFEQTLECIGNSWDGSAMGNAVWTGIRLVELLEHAGLQVDDQVRQIALECGDEYHTTLPIGDLEDLRLVWEMNGEPLPIDHGAPLRMLTPGRYGMKNPKWLVRIAFVEQGEPGTWELLGWSDAAVYKVHSWIASPGYAQVLPLAGCDLVGTAFAGSDPVVAVEISDDEGENWQTAELTYEGPDDAWCLWRFRWEPQSEGEYRLQVRATTLSGVVQTDDEDTDRDLDGWDGIHTIEVLVSRVV